jgi:hypothetical protein
MSPATLMGPLDRQGLYNGALGSSLSLEDLGPDGRILGRIERAAGRFNHNDPSNYLLAHRETVVPSLRPESLDAFEQLIEAINETLTV